MSCSVRRLTSIRRYALLPAIAGLLLAVGFAPNAGAQNAAKGSVSITVVDVSPTTPIATAEASPLTFTISLSNTSAVAVNGLTVVLERGDPITTSAALQSAIAHPRPPSPELVANVQRPGDPPVTANLDAGETKQIPIETASSTSTDNAGLCICTPGAIYPIYFSVQQTQTDGTVAELATTQTFVPAFDAVPTPITVSWVWPLLERPHRLTNDALFIDDDLASSIAVGGRLDRLLQVVEQSVASGIALTLVIDPELVDELSVMSTGYQVSVADAAPVAGTGQAAAAAWLERLRSVLSLPGMEIALTPFAHPDVESLTADGLTWATAMPVAMQSRINAALGGHTADDELAWPARGQLSSPAATTLAEQGVRTLLMVSGSLHPVNKATVITAPSSVTLDSADLTAFSISPSLQTQLSSVLSIGGAGASELPIVVSELAVQAVVNPTLAQHVLLLPPSGLDPEPSAAARAISETSRTSWSQPMPLLAARARFTAQTHSTLPRVAKNALPATTTDAIRSSLDSRPALASMFVQPGPAATLLGGIPDATQRLASSEWSTATEVQRAAGESMSSALDTLVDGVQFVVPTTGSYTLGSNDSPLPVTVVNTLDEPVKVRLHVATVGDLPGLVATDPALLTIPAQGTRPLHVPVHVDRVGRIQVQAVLTAPAPTAAGHPLQIGTPLVLRVRSTALGQIGTIIMWVAGIVLVLALLVRLVRRIKRRGSPPPDPSETEHAPEPTPVGAGE